MKNKKISLLAASLAMVPAMAFAQETKSIMPTNDPSIGTGLEVGMVETPIVDVLSTVANYVIGILLLVAVFYVLWAAYTFMTSAGDAEKVSQARQRIMYAGIGVVIALLARGIVSLVLTAVKSGGQ